MTIVFDISCLRWNCAAPYIKACKRSDPDIDRCITKSIGDLRDKLRTGIPELEVPAVEPLVLKQIRLLRGPQGARLDINLTNIEVIECFGPGMLGEKCYRSDDGV